MEVGDKLGRGEWAVAAETKATLDLPRVSSTSISCRLVIALALQATTAPLSQKKFNISDTNTQVAR